jgi:hypothetical protein
LLLGVILVFFLNACDSKDSPQAPPPVITPAIEAISDSILAPGDTLQVSGRNFADPAGANRVRFNNSLAQATPFFASPESMAVVVPPNANSGAMTVISKGVSSNAKLIEILRALGDVWVMGGGSNYDLKVPVPSGTEEFLIIPHAATSTSAAFAYMITPDTADAFPLPRRLGADGANGTTTFAHEFEINTRRQSIEFLERQGGRGRLALRKAAPGPPPDTTTFFVLNRIDFTTIPASFSTITAELQFAGTHAYIYSDVNQPNGSYTWDDYVDFGIQFDSQIYDTNTTYFGTETDINGDGHVVILFTPEVNKLTPPGAAASQGFISGYFLLNDLGPGIYAPGTTNSMEIFYGMVPDPFAEFGNTFPKPDIASRMPATLAHEFQHMISFGYRFITLGGGSNFGQLQTTWLEEGMAHMAEDLNDMDLDNILRANRYLQNPGPGNVSLMGGDSLEQRGGIYLFLRRLGDLLGEGIYKTILQSGCVGKPCVENVTGKNFHTSVAEFLATLYLSGRGINTDAMYNYASIDLQGDFAALFVTTRTLPAGAFSGAVRNAAGDFYVLTGVQPPALSFRISTSASANLRLVVVQIQ